MTTTALSTLVLPAPFDQVRPEDLGAHVAHGRRQITWRLNDAGTIHRNAFTMAWFEVYESTAWAGRDLWFSALRRINDGPREGFTDAARRALADAVVPVIERYGFDRAWLELRAAHTKAEPAQQAAARARAIASWWDDMAWLAGLLADGAVEFVSVTDPMAYDAATRPMVGSEGRVVRARVAAQAFHAGEHVGWMTVDGDLIPHGASLANL